jgi:hypothetical protein
MEGAYWVGIIISRYYEAREFEDAGHVNAVERWLEKEYKHLDRGRALLREVYGLFDWGLECYPTREILGYFKIAGELMGVLHHAIAFQEAAVTMAVEIDRRKALLSELIARERA